MIYFTYREIVLSLAYALIYGAVSALIFCAFGSVRIIFCEIKKNSVLIFKYDKIYKVRFLGADKEDREMGRVEIFLSTVFLFNMYILLSYHALDGVMRLYMLIAFFASFYLSKIVISAFFDNLLQRLIRLIFSVVIVVFRFIAHPFCRLSLKLKGNFVKKS